MQIFVILAGMFLGGLALSYLSVVGLRHWAEQRQVLDVPNERSSHTRPTPRGGGLAIVAVTLAGIWLIRLAFRFDFPVGDLAAYTAGAILIAGVSWLDDQRSLPNRVRFGVHCLAAVLALLAFGYGRVVPLPIWGDAQLGWIGLPITLLWIVGLTNAYNFMDGIDGLAGGQAVVAGIGWGVLGWASGQALVASVGLLIAASSLGFLGHNWPPARIFMGDVGSAFLGYTFSVLTLIAGESNPAMYVAGILLLWPFIFDAAFTFLRRLLKRENVFRAHRSHLYQRLVMAGHTHRRVSTVYLSLAAWGAGCAWGWVWKLPWAEVLVMVFVLTVALGLWQGTVWRERHTASETA